MEVSGQSSVRPEERRGVVLAFVTLLGILASYALLETARDALFLARLSPQELPWIYIVMAGVAVGLAELPGRGRGLPRPLRLSATLAFGAVVTLGFFFLRPAGAPWLLRAFYVWVGAIATLAGVQFWVLLGDVYTITQAKRLYRAIGTGSLAGAALGAGLARVAASAFRRPGSHRPGSGADGGDRGARVRPRTTGPREARRARPGPLAPGRHPGFFQREPYVTRLAGLVLVSSVAVTIADFVFKSEVARQVAPEDLARFFATFYGLLSLVCPGRAGRD